MEVEAEGVEAQEGADVEQMAQEGLTVLEDEESELGVLEGGTG